MELKEGMYVRTKYGVSQYKRHKVIGSEDITGILCKDGSRVIFVNIEDIIGEPSFNPTDLIEVGDIIDCEYVGIVSKCEIINEDDKLGIGWDNDGDFINLESVEIKSIVTKEQFESMGYKVGD